MSNSQPPIILQPEKLPQNFDPEKNPMGFGPESREPSQAPLDPTPQPQSSQPVIGAAATQDPEKPVDKKVFAERAMSLVEARAKSLMKPQLDDRGRIVIPAIENEDEALVTALEGVQGKMSSEQFYHENGQPSDWLKIRAFLRGDSDEVPAGFEVDRGQVDSQETLDALTRAKVTARFKSDNPVRAALADYVAEPLAKIATSKVQMAIDTGVGLWNMLPGETVEPLNVRAAAVSAMLTLTGQTEGATLGQTYDAAKKAIKGLEENRSGAARVVNAGADIYAFFRGMSSSGGGFGKSIPFLGRAVPLTGRVAKVTGLAGKTMEVGGSVAEKLGKIARVPKSVLPWLRAAGGFAAYEGVTARGVDPVTGKDQAPSWKERGEAAAWGAATGAAAHLFGEVSKSVFRGMFQNAYKALGSDEKAALDVIQQWGVANRVLPLENEAAGAWEKRVIGQWVDAGMPGLKGLGISAQKLGGYAMQGGIEGAGFSMLDAQVHKDLIALLTDEKARSNPEVWGRLIESYAGNALGAAALHMPAKSIVPWQRRQDIAASGDPAAFEKKKQDAAKAAQDAEDAKHQVVTEDGRTIDTREPFVPAPTGEQKGGGLQYDVEAESKRAAANREAGIELDDMQRRLRNEFPQENALRLADAAERGGQWWDSVPNGEQQAANLTRLGWDTKPAEDGKSTEVTLLGGKHSFTTDGTTSRPNPEIRKALGVGEEVALPDLLSALERASLIDAQMAARLLPGDKVSADGVVADPKDGVLRTVRMGEVLEAPISANPQWHDAGSFPARGKDHLPDEQEQAVAGLRQLLNGREDLPQPTRTMLDNVISTFDTVSVLRDHSVAEALHALPSMEHALFEGTPEEAGEAIHSLAELLTTKSQQVVVAEKQRERAQKQVREPMHVRFGESDYGYNVDRERGEAIPSQPLREALGVGERVPLDEMAQKVIDSEIAKKASKLKAGERVFGKASERGTVDIGGVVSIARAAVKGLSKLIGHPLSWAVDNPLTRLFTEDVIGEVKRVAGKKAADTFWQIRTESSKLKKRYDVILNKLKNLGNGRDPELDRVVWNEQAAEGGTGYGFSVGHILKESDLMALKQMDRSMVSDKTRRDLELHDELMAAEREDAHDLGVQIRNALTSDERRLVVARERDKKVLTRQFTPTALDAMLTGSGRIYDGIVDAVAHANGVEPAAVQKAFVDNGWTEGRGVKRIDPIETMRTLKYFPDHIKLPDGEVVRLLETDLTRHAKRSAHNTSARLGTIKVLGQDLSPTKGDVEDSKQGAAEAGVTWVPSENVPTPYLKFIESFPREQRDTIAKAVRASMNMAITRSNPALRADTPLGKHMEIVNAVMDVAAAAKMTMSAVQNIAEPLGMTSAIFGIDRMASAAAHVYGQIAEGNLKGLVEEAINKGGFSSEIPDWHAGFTGEASTHETVKKAARTLSGAFMIPFDMTQVATDLLVHRAIHDAVDAFQRGEGRHGDVDGLRNLFDLTSEEAASVVSGKASPELYDRIRFNGLSLITRRGEVPLGRSAMGRSHQVQKWVRFTSFFQRSLETTRKAVVMMRDAKTPEEAAGAVTNFAKVLGFNALAGVVGQSLVSFLRGGKDEFMQLWLENLQNPARATATTLLGSLAGGMGSALVGGTRAFLFGSEKEKANQFEQLPRMVLPVAEALDAFEFASAMFHRAVGKPITESPYSGKTPLQQLGYFMGQQIPLVKAVEGGLFGIGVDYMGSDPELHNAISASYRWDNRNAPDSGSMASKDAEFLDMMRQASNMVRAEHPNYNEIEQFIRSRMPGKDDKDIAASFRARRILSGRSWEELTPAQQADKLKSLTPKYAELLRGYDAALDSMAERFGPMFPSHRRRR